mgnify:FL=1
MMKKMIKDFFGDFKLQVRDIKNGNIKRQIPNMLTFSRALSPFIIIPAMLFGEIKIAIGALIFFAITDFLDGKIARKYNYVSDFGVKLDAVCDKIFAMSLVIPAVFECYILLFNLILEIAISYTNLLSEAKGNHPRSTIIGKIKTTLLSITLILIYIPKTDIKIIFIASIVTIICQVITLIKYINIDMDKDRKRKKNKI